MVFDDPLFALRVALVGKPGTGKSDKMLSLLRGFPRVVLFDSLGRYVKPLPFESRIRKLLGGFDRVEACRLADYLRERLCGEFRCVVYAVADRELWFEVVCCLVAGAQEIVFAVDEARMICSPQTPLGRHFSRIVNWRGDRVRLFWNSQRPAQVHNDLRAAATDWFVFQTTGANDLKSLDAEGVPVYEANVAGLARRAFLYYRHDGQSRVIKPRRR